MAEVTIVVDPPIASSSALPPAPAPALLPVVTIINSNVRIIPASAFILKVIPAANAAKPIPCQYTSSTETRPSVWINVKKAYNLADHMDIIWTISMLKHLETHIAYVVHPPQDTSLKWQTPSLDFIFTENDFLYLLESGTLSKCQCIDDGTISLGSPSLSLDFVRDFDVEYFTLVSIFLDHEPDANYIEQSLVWQCNLTSPAFFGLYKNIFITLYLSAFTAL